MLKAMITVSSDKVKRKKKREKISLQNRNVRKTT